MALSRNPPYRKAVLGCCRDEADDSQVQALGSKAGALTKAVENALSQRSVVTIEMMAASGADDLRLSLKELTRGVILVSAVEALNHARVDRRERRFSR